MFKNLNIKKVSLGLAVIVLACFAFASLLFYQIDIKDYKDNKNQHEINEEKTFETEEIKNINIDSSSADINIIEYDDNKVKVHIYGHFYKKYKDDNNEPVIELNNGQLDIMQSRKSSIMSLGINFNIGELFNDNEMQMDVYVPKGYKDDINIESSSGNIKTDNLELKKLDIDTFSGKIELKDVTADKVSLETSSGDISAGNIKSDDIKINTFSGNNNYKSIDAQKVYFESSSGDISLGSVNAEVIEGDTFSGHINAKEVKSKDGKFTTSSGNIIINYAEFKKVICDTFSGDVKFENAQLNDTQIETSSGNVAISLLEDAEFKLDADSSSGNILCEFAIVKGEDEGNHELRGVVGNATNVIEIDTFSGDIDINKHK